MPFTSHPDIRGHYLGGYIIAQKDSLMGVYDYISKLPRTDPWVKIYGDDFLVYSPVTYWLHAAWLKLPAYSHDMLERLITNMDQTLKEPNVGWLLIFLKTPYLIADAFCLWLMLKIVDTKYRELITVLWIFNLPLIHSAYMMGQFDIFIVLFILLATYFAKSERSVLGAISLAVSAGFKPFGLFLLPFLPGNRIKNVLVGIIAYIAIIAPYALTSPAYRMYALAAQQSDKIWYAKILVSGSQYLPLFMVGIVVLFWLSFKNFKSLPWWGWLMSPFLIFYSVTHYHPQWFSWISPFLILAFVLKPKTRWLVLTMFVAHLAVLFSFEPSLNFGLFGINYSLHWLLTDQNMSLVRGVLAATSLSMIFFLKE
jgi:hypothetical protein